MIIIFMVTVMIINVYIESVVLFHVNTFVNNKDV